MTFFQDRQLTKNDQVRDLLDALFMPMHLTVEGEEELKIKIASDFFEGKNATKRRDLVLGAVSEIVKGVDSSSKVSSLAVYSETEWKELVLSEEIAKKKRANERKIEKVRVETNL